MKEEIHNEMKEDNRDEDDEGSTGKGTESRSMRGGGRNASIKH